MTRTQASWQVGPQNPVRGRQVFILEEEFLID
jgi:hypothetical protein